MARSTVKLTDRQVVDIRRRYQRGETVWLIASRYGVAAQTVYNIGNRHSRSDADPAVDSLPPSMAERQAERPIVTKRPRGGHPRATLAPLAVGETARTNAELAARRKAANARLAELRAKQGERLAMFGDKPKER